MICQECGQKPATLHFTKIVNGEKIEFGICETCAGENGEVFPVSSSTFSIHHLLSGLINFDGSYSSKGEASTESLQQCTNCGLTHSQFSQTGRFGCADCYQQFSQRLGVVFRRIHGNMEHSGKVPQRAGGDIRMRKEINELKQKLKQKIETEEFEEAATLRDQIKELEEQMTSS